MENLLIIIGCAKAGTSALAQMLDAQPGFRRGTHKETQFFCDLDQQSWSGPGIEGFLTNHRLFPTKEAFFANFETAPGQWAIDASTDYIWYPGVAEAIAAFSKDVPVKLVCVVRDPVDRAVSEYNHTIRAGWETLSFSDAVAAEDDRIAKGYQPLFYHKRRSTISSDLQRFRDVFGQGLLILDYADMQDPDRVIGAISDLVGVTPADHVPQARKNESQLPRNKMADRILNSDKVKGVARKIVPASVRQSLWRALHTNARNLQTVTPDEKASFRALLAEEIGACQAAPDIPTETWKTALAQG